MAPNVNCRYIPTMLDHGKQNGIAVTHIHNRIIVYQKLAPGYREPIGKPCYMKLADWDFYIKMYQPLEYV